MKQLKIAWLYPDLLELYGDRGNIIILKHRADELGVQLKVDEFSIGDHFIPKHYDLIFLGGGADQDQGIFYDDLIKRRELLLEAIEDNVSMVLICGGYQLFGEYYLDAYGNKLDGLKIFDFYSEASEKRSIGYLTISCKLDGETFNLSGFENHGGQTKNVNNPLGNVLSGYGNNRDDKHEGFTYKNVIGTYLHGPLLSRNPELTDLLLRRMAKRNRFELDFSKGDSNFEKLAKKQILKEQNLI